MQKKQYKQKTKQCNKILLNRGSIQNWFNGHVEYEKQIKSLQNNYLLLINQWHSFAS